MAAEQLTGRDENRPSYQTYIYLLGNNAHTRLLLLTRLLGSMAIHRKHGL